MAQLDLSFLGTFQVSLDGQPITRFRSSNNQGLLVYLALNHDRALPREVLAALFWPEESDKNGRNNLRQALYQLRTLLGDTKNGANPYLLVSRHTVQLNPDSDYMLDVKLFLDAIEARDLEMGTTQYRGELLPGFTCDSLPFEDWLRQERESLHHLALETMGEVTRDHLANGKPEQALADARRQLALEPWREPAHRQLMRAYALTGDRANALAQYEQCQDILWEEMGVEPAPETMELMEAIKAGRYAPDASVDRMPPPVRFQHNLPASTTPLIGRELELEKVSRLLLEERRRLVTIVGPGGMGKTRLALALGAILLQDFGDGVFLVDLAPLTRPEEIILAIATAVDYQAPDTTAELGPQLLAMLSRRQLLLILDNFEHLLAGADLVNEILQGCPKVSLLVTSRQRLNLASESRFELGGLDYPPSPSPEDALEYTAVELFVDGGRRANSQFVLSGDNVEDVIHICQLVQGIPLGLLLAAAWLELLSSKEIATEIEQSLDFLAADLADLPERQRSMQAVFDRSWEMMTPSEQSVMAKLSVFRGGFTRQAAEQVAGANLRILLSLVNKSLLQRQADNGRFSMHELLRQYAAEQQRKVDPDDQNGLRHCRYFAQEMAEEAGREPYFLPIHLPSQRMADADNMRRAWEYALHRGLADVVDAMVSGMIAFSFAQGVLPSAVSNQAMGALQQHGFAATDPVMLRLRLLGIIVRFGHDDEDEVRSELMNHLSLLEELEAYELCYHAYATLAHLFPDGEAALIWDGKARRVVQKTGNPLLITWSEVDSLIIRVWHHMQEESLLEPLQERLAYYEELIPGSFIVFTLLGALSSELLRFNEYERALDYGRRCLNIAKGWRDLYWIGGGADRIADVYVQMGEPGQARLQHLDVLEWHLAIGQVWQTLGFLTAKSVWVTELMGDKERIVQVLSMIYHHPEAAEFHKQLAYEARPQFEEAIGSTAFEAAWEMGREMDFDTAVAQVRFVLGGS